MSIDKLKIGNSTLNSRLILGTGKFSDNQTMIEAIKASATELVTVALRRFNMENRYDDLYGPLSELKNVSLMPNTSGAQTAEEAVKVAMLGREISGSSIVKVEIHPNPHHLLPDPIETFNASEVLVKEGFDVLPYIPPDPVLCKRLEDVGCAAVMPLGSPIGTGRGIEAGGMMALIIKDSNVPVIIDAGLRSPGEAAAAIEMGCDAVLVNSAIAASDNPSKMAEAFAMAVEAGMKARAAGLMAVSPDASPTSPLTSFLSEPET